jgi:alginate O-acetyltransferase complex protein AlgI
MLFNSFVFIVFASIFFLLWPLLKRNNQVRWIYIVAASFIFYGWWDWRFLILIMASGFLDFFAAMGMEKYAKFKKLFLGLSILGNVGSLAIFKYLTFIILNTNSALTLFGFEMQLPVVAVALPVGISFYTFQSMSYTIDVYRGELKVTHNVFHFFAYLSMFPQLVAGPIIRASHLLPQLLKVNEVSEADRWEGLRLITYGYVKKMILADNLAPVVNWIFSGGSGSDSAFFWWIAVLMFAFQIYFDFSGYSDIARGLAKWMGYDFALNFNHPYVSSSIRDFWGRWHISLSTWFRDYVYIPLGGSRKGKVRSDINMWITMLISGLWHGAGWTFVAWGALHAFYLSVERITGWPQKLSKSLVGKFFSHVITMISVLVAWVYFRAESFSQANAIVKNMFNFSKFHFNGFENYHFAIFVPLIVSIIAEVLFYYDTKSEITGKSTLMRKLEPAIIAICMVLSVYLAGPGTQFIYFQF